mmetsp:Transcript_17579/g.29678  ORF Transcript_17579/g.29678 Transcript_17579/m.29678 type:complete len:87 (-) Transcript_17579:243-503(-)
MASKKKKIYHFPINSAEHFQEIISNEEGPLVIIDAHLDWCGPCTPMEPNYPSIWFSYEEPEKRLSFWTCNEKFIPEEVLSKLELTC